MPTSISRRRSPAYQSSCEVQSRRACRTHRGACSSICGLPNGISFASVLIRHVSPKFPDGYWPAGDAPPDSHAWDRSVASFQADLQAMKDLVANPETDLFKSIPHGQGQTILREALLVADHNAYHLGQLVTVPKAAGRVGRRLVARQSSIDAETIAPVSGTFRSMGTTTSRGTRRPTRQSNLGGSLVIADSTRSAPRFSLAGCDKSTIIRLDVNEHVSDRRHLVSDLVFDGVGDLMADFDGQLGGNLDVNVDQVVETTFPR